MLKFARSYVVILIIARHVRNMKKWLASFLVVTEPVWLKFAYELKLLN